MTTQPARLQTKMRAATLLGGILGLGVFLVVGLLPSALYGGYAGVILWNGIFGTPIYESLFAQATVVLGVLFGVLAIGALFVVGGAIVATGLGVMLAMLTVVAEERSARAKARQAQEVQEVPEVHRGRRVAT